MGRKIKFKYRGAEATIDAEKAPDYEVVGWSAETSSLKLTEKPWTFEVFKEGNGIKYGSLDVSENSHNLVQEKLEDGYGPVIIGKKKAVKIEGEEVSPFNFPFYVMDVELKNSFDPISGEKLTKIVEKNVYKTWKKNGAAPTYVNVLGSDEANRKEIAATGNFYWALRERLFNAKTETEAENLRTDRKTISKTHQLRIESCKKKGVLTKAIDSVAYATVLGIGYLGETLRSQNEGCIDYVNQAEATGWEIPSDIVEGAKLEQVGTWIGLVGMGLAIGIPTGLALYHGGKRLLNKKRQGHGGGVLKERDVWGTWNKPGLYDYVAACGLLPNERNFSGSSLLKWGYAKGR